MTYHDDHANCKEYMSTFKSDDHQKMNCPVDMYETDAPPATTDQCYFGVLSAPVDLEHDDAEQYEYKQYSNYDSKHDDSKYDDSKYDDSKYESKYYGKYDTKKYPYEKKDHMDAYPAKYLYDSDEKKKCIMRCFK